MRNKKIIIILATLIVLIGAIFLVYNIYKNKNKLNKTKRKKQDNLAIMIKEDGSDNYSSSSSIPIGDYVLNEEKTICENGGKVVSYDSSTGQIGFSFLGSDRCSLYFDYKEDMFLYATIKKRAKTDTTFLELYTGDGADTYAKSVYYYKDNVQNNNVLFGGFCWKIVRTTETGGTKLVYNGIPKEGYNDYILLNESEYKNLTNDANYPYIFDSTDKTWTSTNTGANSSTISFKAPSSGNYVFNYDLSIYDDHDANYIYVEVFKDNVSQGKFNGINIGQIIFSNLSSSNLIKVVFTRKYSWTDGSRNNIIFSFGRLNDENNKTLFCNNIKAESQIGTSAFNSNSNSLAYVGYMYNTVYEPSNKQLLERTYFTGTKAYADSVKYNSSTGKYTLDSKTAKTIDVSDSNGSTLIEKYTCNQSTTTGTCTNVYYIIGYNDRYIYYHSLSNGDVDGSAIENNYIFGNSFNYLDGIYTLNDTATINLGNWPTEKSTINNNHYTCMTTGTTCSSIYYVYYTGSASVNYITLTEGKSVSDALNEMLYADNVNSKDSTIKTYIDNWYENNLIKYQNKLEDTVFCNDRSIPELSGWNPNGGDVTSGYLYFNGFTKPKSLVCTNETDRFSTSNAKAKLKYPVGLLSSSELALSNWAWNTTVYEHYYNSQEFTWLGSPFASLIGEATVDMTATSALSSPNYDPTMLKGVRPSVSLKPGTKYVSGIGTYNLPFIIE